MLKVNGKDVVYQNWFIIGPKGDVTLDVPFFKSNPIAKFEIRELPEHLEDRVSPVVRSDRRQWEHGLVATSEGRDMKFSMPFLWENDTDVTPIGFDVEGGGHVLSGQISRQKLNGGMLVHFIIYNEPAA